MAREKETIEKPPSSSSPPSSSGLRGVSSPAGHVTAFGAASAAEER